MANIEELLVQKAALEKRIAEAQSLQRAAAIAQIHEMMTLSGLIPADLGDMGPRPNPRKGIKAPVKYRDLAGNTWSGRGLQPKWLVKAIAQGRQLSDFAV